MGRGRRPRPEKLQEKLGEIRMRLAITQDEMAKRLILYGAEETVSSGYIADFETGKREPSLLAILAYAKLLRISTDILIDDELDLPKKLPSKPKHKNY